MIAPRFEPIADAYAQSGSSLASYSPNWRLYSED